MGLRQADDVKPDRGEIGSEAPDGVRDGARLAAVRAEQAYVSRVYERLDTERAGAEAALRQGPAAGGGGAFQARLESAVATDEAARRLARLAGVENGLCFGRIDHRSGADGPGDTFYIGRIGLRDEYHEPMLIDWRAEAARPFYTATPGAPGTLARRRHLHLRHREVVRLDDEVFDLEGLDEAERGGIVGEAALLATLRRGRTGRMGDVVATIQEEQDQVIRSALQGVLVVQGGPGTGKTVAALHRAAYLLYTHRDVLERRGVLIVGPNATFLRYIEQVLPGLGETDVALATVGELYPGLKATAADSPAVAVVKGDLRMAALVEAAVRDRQRVPDGGLSVESEGMTLRVEAAACELARDRARALRAPHNLQRRRFVHDLLDALALNRAEQFDRLIDEPLEEITRSGNVPGWLQELLDEAGESPLLDEADLRLAKESLWHEPPVREAIDALWPELTPERLLTGLYADPEALGRLGEAAGLPGAALLHRPPGSPWTVADVPVLDEAAEWLGSDDSGDRARRRAAAARREADERYAREVIESTGAVTSDAQDLAALVAERHRDDGPPLTTAQRAAADREWAYGHVIVDEAQELSEMAWRAVMRRVPTRSLTVVGDIAQTGSAAGASSWGRMLDRYVPGRWREQRLMVNYRTPAAIMRVAEDVLAAVAPGEIPPEPVRDDGPPPRAVAVPVSGLPGLVRAELAEVAPGPAAGRGPEEGRLAVISSAAWHPGVLEALPDAAAGATPEALDSPVVVLTAAEAKGLEFDSVVVVDPAGVLAESPKGGQDLYVALTRATRRLTVVHDGDLPDMLARLEPGGPGPSQA
ncbi:ATP-binding domain-containing protein [Actinomadura graeca]|uniref:ATP-binding domain-containing protein n=1 Tax=Actinomadura graeca TaxID=2750812 RepID=A0ABX8QP26_9ACTN|nr:ATP-binding domain-containing protein [Actinomadura graeca]QXJ20545.1 ATP-binding domain-containing protein [Actinomadura graeca]